MRICMYELCIDEIHIGLPHLLQYTIVNNYGCANTYIHMQYSCIEYAKYRNDATETVATKENNFMR